MGTSFAGDRRAVFDVSCCPVLFCCVLVVKGPSWMSVCNGDCWQGLDGASSHAQWVVYLVRER